MLWRAQMAEYLKKEIAPLVQEQGALKTAFDEQVVTLKAKKFVEEEAHIASLFAIQQALSKVEAKVEAAGEAAEAADTKAAAAGQKADDLEAQYQVDYVATLKAEKARQEQIITDFRKKQAADLEQMQKKLGSDMKETEKKAELARRAATKNSENHAALENQFKGLRARERAEQQRHS